MENEFRVSKVYLEVLVPFNSPVHVSKVYLEVLRTLKNPINISKTYLEVLRETYAKWKIYEE